MELVLDSIRIVTHWTGGCVFAVCPKASLTIPQTSIPQADPSIIPRSRPGFEAVLTPKDVSGTRGLTWIGAV